jgi:hypothetical protein
MEGQKARVTEKHRETDRQRKFLRIKWIQRDIRTVSFGDRELAEWTESYRVIER